MIDALQFLNYDFVVPTTFGALFLFALFIWKEWTFPLKSKFYLHIAIALISIISLAMLFLKPAIWKAAQTTAGVLLTEGYQEKRLDSLKKKHESLKVVPYKNNFPIGEVLDSIVPLFLLGEGVQPFDFWQFENRPINNLGTELDRGITRLRYENKLSVGDSLLVRGEYHDPTKGHKLILADAGGNELDSVLLQDAPKTDFELSAELKVSGNYLYEVREKDSLGNVVLSEPLPLSVVFREKLKLLMVNSFPTFESKYLKNFLAAAGHELIVRSQLTRGKYKFEYFNTERRPFYSYTKKLLEAVDLIVIDVNSYRNLSRKSLQVFEEGLRADGLGLLILPDASFFRLPSKTSNFEFSRAKSTKTNWNKWPELSLEKYAYQFEEDVRLEEVHRSEDLLLTAYRRKGKGRVGTMLIQNSYQLLLDGNTKGYKQFWSEIVSDLSKRKPALAEWDYDIKFPVKNEPFFFELRTSEENPRVIGENGRIPLMQNPDIPELWNGTTYPRTSGWHKIGLQNDSAPRLSFYVIDSTKWKSIRSFNTMTQNKSQFRVPTDLPAHKKTLRPIEPFWFFLIFILGMGYLWLAPKIFHH